MIFILELALGKKNTVWSITLALGIRTLIWWLLTLASVHNVLTFSFCCFSCRCLVLVCSRNDIKNFKSESPTQIHIVLMIKNIFFKPNHAVFHVRLNPIFKDDQIQMILQNLDAYKQCFSAKNSISLQLQKAKTHIQTRRGAWTNSISAGV